MKRAAGATKRRTKRRRPMSWRAGSCGWKRMVCFTCFFSLYVSGYYCILHVASCRALQYSYAGPPLLLPVTSCYIQFHGVGKIIIISYQGNSYLHETHHNCHQEHTLLTHLGSYKVAVPQDGHRFMMIPASPSVLLGF